MDVRAKCRVTKKSNAVSVNPYVGEVPQVEVILQPVYGVGDDDANKSWSKFTPSGEVRLVITNPAASDALELGKAYFLTFTPAD